ncbi:unnamed protein product [Ophioblennius macclurei]
MMKGILSGLLVVLLLSVLVSKHESTLLRSHHYYNLYYTWEEAQSHCRNFHTDLSVFSRGWDPTSVDMLQYKAWTGLHKNAEGNWVWSTGQPASLADFGLQEPNGTEGCAYVHYSSRRLFLADCEDYYLFCCYEPKEWNKVKCSFPGKTWSGALEVCKMDFEGLAYFESARELNGYTNLAYPIWFGLYKDGGVWKWSFGSSDYREWGSTWVETTGDCASLVSVRKKMVGRNCSERLPFLCVDDNVKLVKEKKSWEEALQHCRGMAPSGYDLLSVQPGDDHADILERAMGADTEEVWVGLRFLAGHWLWMTGADVSYPDLPQCPLQGEHCGALSKTSMTTVETRDCAERKNFLCYKK